MGSPDAFADEVARRERGLRRGAAERVVSSGDASLTELFRAVHDRRARRSAIDGTGLAHRTERPAEAEARSSGVRVLGLESYGPTVRVFRLSRPAGFAFQAGQYLQLGVPGGRREDFSIASAPHEPHLDLAIELRPAGRVTPALFRLAVGDAVEIGRTAKGSLRLDRRAAHHLMVATVTGIAPLRSMLRAALHDGTQAQFTVLLGASHAVELPFHEELTALAATEPRLNYQATISQPGAAGDRPWHGRTGRVDGLAADIAATIDPAGGHVYAVGNKGMIASVRDHVGRAGLRISTESYGG